MTTYTVARYNGEKTQFEFNGNDPQQGTWISSDFDTRGARSDIRAEMLRMFGIEVNIEMFTDVGRTAGAECDRGKFWVSRKRV